MYVWTQHALLHTHARELSQNLPRLDLLVQQHTPCVSPPLFAQNLLCLDLAKQLGIDIPDPFFTWLYGAALPALAGARATGFRKKAREGAAGTRRGQGLHLHPYPLTMLCTCCPLQGWC